MEKEDHIPLMHEVLQYASEHVTFTFEELIDGLNETEIHSMQLSHQNTLLRKIVTMTCRWEQYVSEDITLLRLHSQLTIKPEAYFGYLNHLMVDQAETQIEKANEQIEKANKQINQGAKMIRLTLTTIVIAFITVLLSAVSIILQLCNVS